MTATALTTASPHPACALIRAVNIGGPIEQSAIFVEYIPRDLVDVERKPLNQATYSGSLVNDARTGQSLYNTIISAQEVGSRLLAYVIPQNLFFVFSESAQALTHMPLESPLAEPGGNESVHRLCNANAQQGYTTQEADAEPLAVVFCQISDANPLRELCGREQQEPKNQTDCYQVFWGELDSLKKVLEEVKGHTASVGQGGAA